MAGVLEFSELGRSYSLTPGGGGAEAVAAGGGYGRTVERRNGLNG